MIITIEHILRWSRYDYPIALNSYQFRILGLGWPPKHGWVRRLIGREIDDSLDPILRELCGIPKKDRRKVLERHGTSASQLFKRGMLKGGQQGAVEETWSI